MPHPKVKISDNSGNEVAVTDNALHVNVAGATMSTGDIEVNSEFPAAATITDNFANPSTTSVMSMGMAWDGATWDRLLGNSTDGLLVNLGSNNDVSVSGDALTALQLIDDAIHVDDASFTVGSHKGIMMMGYAGTNNVTSGNAGALSMDTSGRLQVAVLSTPYDAAHDGTVSGKGQQIMLEAKVRDGSQFPNIVAEGDATRPAASRWGVQFTSLVDDSGSNTPLAIDNSPYSDFGGHINIGGKYNSSAPTYADGDTAVFQTDVNGKLLISDGGGTITVDDGGGSITVDDGGNAITVDGTVAVNTISGFATEAKQPSLGTAGSASANVITVQGIASMTPLTVDLAGNNDVTITSGTVTANLGTTDTDHLSEIEGAVETIESAIYVDDADWDGSSKHMLVGGLYGSNTITSGDVGPIALAADGAVHINDGGNTITVNVASGGIASGGIASGAVASGAFASGSIASGAIASGAVAAGAVVSGAVLSGAFASGSIASGALASGSIASGAVASGALASGSIVDGAMVTLGAKADAKNDATDGTAITAMQVLKQISASVQETATDTGTIDSDTNAIKNAVETIDNAISGSEMQVDVVAALPAGSNAIGKLAANSGVDIGDVDVTSTVHPAGNGTFNSYAQFAAATSPTALTDATNGVNSTETAAKEVIIQADYDNSGYLMVGDSGAAADTNGIRLNAGDTIILPVANIANIYIDASASSQNVNVTVIK
jgi:uncharacterized protein YjbI with pentapeptide repeats